MTYLTATQTATGDASAFVSFNYPSNSTEYQKFPGKVVFGIALVTSRTKNELKIDAELNNGFIKYNAETDYLQQLAGVGGNGYDIRGTSFNNLLLTVGAAGANGWGPTRPHLYIGIVDGSYTYGAGFGFAITPVGPPPSFAATVQDRNACVAYFGQAGNDDSRVQDYTWEASNTNTYVFYTPEIATPSINVADAIATNYDSVARILNSIDASTIINQPFTFKTYAYDYQVNPDVVVSTIVSNPVDSTSATFSYDEDMFGLSPSTGYKFRTQVTDSLGNKSAFSALSSGSVTTDAAPPNFSKVPTNVRLEFIDDTQQWLGFRVRWDLPEQVTSDIALGVRNSNDVYYAVLVFKNGVSNLAPYAEIRSNTLTSMMVDNTLLSGVPLFTVGDYTAAVRAKGYDSSPLEDFDSEISGSLTLAVNVPPPPPAPTEVLTQWVDPAGFRATFVKDTSTDGIIQLVISRVKYSVDNVQIDAEYYEIGGTYEVLGTTYDMRIATVYSRDIVGPDSFIFTYGNNPADETPIEPIYTYNFVVNAYAPDSVTALSRLPIVNAPVAASSTFTTPAVLATLNDYFTLVVDQITFPKSLAVTWQVPVSNGSEIDKFSVQVTSAPGSGGLSFTHEISNVKVPGTTYLLTVMDTRDFKLLTGGGPILGNSGLYGTYPTFDPRMVTLINLPQYYTLDVGVPVGTYTVKIFALSSTGAFNATDAPSASLSSRAPRLPAPVGPPNIYQTGSETLTLDGWGLGVTGATGPGAFIDTPRWYNLICKVESGSTGPQLRRRFSYTDAVSEVTTQVVTGLDATKTYTFHTFFELVGVSGQQGMNLPAPISFAVPELTSVPKETVTTVVLPPDIQNETAPVVVLFENVSAPTSGNTAQTVSYEVVATDASTGEVLATETVLVSDITGGELLGQKSFSETLIDAGALPEDIPEVPATIAQNITANPETPLGMGSVVFTALPVATTVTFTVQAKSAGGTNTSLLRAAPAAFIDDLPIPPPPPPCFVTGTQILTDEGYKAVETLVPGEDLVMTSDGRAVTFKLYSRTVTNANTDSAPYRILAGAFGPNSPPQDICLSGMHAIQSSDGVWQVPEFVAKKNSMVQQYDLGKTVTYYHIECSNFFNDNLVAQGAVVESFRNRQAGNERVLYKFVAELDGFIRVQEDEVIPVELEKMAVSVM